MGVTEIEAPEGFTLRVPRMEEAGEVAALINAAMAAAGGPPDNSESEVRCAWTTPGIDFESAFRVVVDDTGRIVGYLSLEEREPFTKIWLDGFTHPEFLGHGIGSCLLRYAETRAGELATWAPGREASVLRHFVWAGDRMARRLLEAHGYRLVRHFNELIVDLDPALPEPVWPDGIVVRTMLPGDDDRAVWEAIEESFRDHWGFELTPFEEFAHRHFHGDEDFDPTLNFLAMDSEQVAGAALCRVNLPHDPRKGWVKSLGVRRPWRRRGIALALLQQAFGEFRRRGYERAGLGVDTENPTGAMDLYEKAGMRIEHKAVVLEKQLRRA